MIRGMPRFTKVDLVASSDERDGRVPLADSLATGREDEISGLLVKRLWIRGFFCRRVVIPSVAESSLLDLDEMAASFGEMSSAEEEGGRMARQPRTRSRVST